MTDTPAAAWGSVRAHAVLSNRASALVLAAILAILVTGVALLARRLGLRRTLSWCFALGVGCWLSAPFTADTAAGGLLAAAGLLMMPAAVAAELLLRRRDLDTDRIR